MATTRKATRKPAAGTRRGRRHRGLLSNFLTLVSLTFFGRMLMITLLGAVILSLNLLVSGNQFDLFFLITGLELIGVAIFFWLRFLLKK
ncbi:MAG: hypothetical protein PHX55_09710 [Eubacteriales bacterium]|nr:hypothetical protein [Eubacteriales bacterium]